LCSSVVFDYEDNNSRLVEAVVFNGYIENERMVFKMADLKGNLSNSADSKPTAVGGMSRECVDSELKKGIDSAKNGQVYTVEEVDAALKKEFNI